MNSTIEVHAPRDKSIGSLCESASTRPQPVPTVPELDGIRVVLVEDEADALDVTRRILERRGAHVLTGVNGLEGLAATRIARPDIVVTDLTMPVMDGYGLMLEIRAAGPASGGAVPLIALSAHCSSEERWRTQRAGFALHLEKPTPPTALIQAIVSIVEQTKRGLSF